VKVCRILLNFLTSFQEKRKGKICGNEWFSGNAYFNTWQKCQKCHNKCKPYYLKEHDESNGVVTKPHPDRLCQKCMEFKEETGNSFARCDGREDYFVDENLLRERAIMMKKAKKIREEERRLEESKKRKEAEKKEHKRREEEDKKKKEGKKELAKENFKSEFLRISNFFIFIRFEITAEEGFSG